MDLSEQSELAGLILLSKKNKQQSLLSSENPYDLFSQPTTSQSIDIELTSPLEQHSVVFRNNLQIKNYLKVEKEDEEQIQIFIKQTVQDLYILHQQQKETSIITQSSCCTLKQKPNQTTNTKNLFEKQKLQAYDNLEFAIKNDLAQAQQQSEDDQKFAKMQEDQIQQSFQK